jgi:hypothetical protein
MRRHLALLVVAACGELPAEAPPETWLDSGVWDPGPEDCFSYAWCEGGNLYRIPPVHDQPSCPPELPGDQFGICAWGCASNEPITCWPDAPCTLLDVPALCYQPPGAATCALDGLACDAEGALEPCAAELACSSLVQVGSCACAEGTWRCEPACADGLCSAEEVLAAMVGTWQGMVDPPPFSAPYPVTLEILPDGHYIGDCPLEDCTTFYYGMDGYHDLARLWVEAQTELGAFVAIELVFGPNGSTATSPGLLRGVRVDADTMTFTFIDAWLGCVRPFEFTLQRVR